MLQQSLGSRPHHTNDTINEHPSSVVAAALLPPVAGLALLPPSGCPVCCQRPTRFQASSRGRSRWLRHAASGWLNLAHPHWALAAPHRQRPVELDASALGTGRLAAAVNGQLAFAIGQKTCTLSELFKLYRTWVMQSKGHCHSRPLERPEGRRHREQQ